MSLACAPHYAQRSPTETVVKTHGFRREHRRVKAPERSKENVKNDWVQVVVKIYYGVKIVSFWESLL